MEGGCRNSATFLTLSHTLNMVRNTGRRGSCGGRRELCYDVVISLARGLLGAMDETDFRSRCESALTHPATIAAICALLLNDLVFKSLWPDAWVTGKLSDLAWVAFAPPLLAFLLSFAAGGNARAQRAAFVTAYIGLPLLYAAFNTFEPVHDVITWGLSLASGRASGGPLDATDSLVIPLGMSVALWVWRRPSAGSHRLRAQAALLVASLASLASVASSPAETELGITYVGLDEDDALVTQASWNSPSVGEQSVETPRGVYSIEGSDEGSDVVRSTGGRKEVAYSAAYLRERGNINVQSHFTRHLAPRRVTTRPYSIAYDQHTGNVVVAMGLQGIVVGTPDGRWTREAVGRYAPTDFSIVRKLLLLWDWELWLLAGAVALSFTALVLSLSEPASAFQPNKTARVIVSSLAVIASIVGILYYTADGEPLSTAQAISIGSGTLGLGLAVLVGIGSYMELRRWVSVMGADAVDEEAEEWRRWVSGGLATGRGGSISARLRGGLLPVTAAAIAGMLALITLLFFLWVQQGMDLALVKLWAIVLTALTAFILWKYLKGRMPMMPEPVTVRMCPCGCGKMIEEHGG